MEKNFTASELQGHRISVTSPGPVYQTILTDLETGYTIANAIAITITGDVRTNWSSLTATVRLADVETQAEEAVVVSVYNAHLTAEVTQAEAVKEATTDPALPAITVEPEAQ